MTTKDHFHTLGVPDGASDEEIKKAYKRLAMKHHPDRGGDQAKFQEIQEAYDVLSTPQRRAQWDQERQFGQGGDSGTFNFNFGFGGGMEDFMRQAFGGGGHPFHGFRQQPKNRDVRIVLDIDLVSTLEKQSRQININQANGTGKTVNIDIPRGVMTGMQMRCQGLGDQSIGNLPPGDLYVEFRVHSSADFQVNGIHLQKTLKLNCLDAIVGTTQTVVGLDGKKFDVTIPSGTQGGTKLRIPGQGLWDVNQPIRGDLFIEISLQVPQALTRDQLDQLTQFVK